MSIFLEKIYKPINQINSSFICHRRLDQISCLQLQGQGLNLTLNVLRVCLRCCGRAHMGSGPTKCAGWNDWNLPTVYIKKKKKLVHCGRKSDNRLKCYDRDPIGTHASRRARLDLRRCGQWAHLEPLLCTASA